MNNFFRADLHCHSTCSDGTLTPTQLLELAQESGLQGLSITDHDTYSAYNEAVPAAKELGITLIPGAEFSTVHKGQSIHVLGYAFPLYNKVLDAFCAHHKKRRINRCHAILERLREQGIDIPVEEILGDRERSGSIGRPHIAMALMRRGLVKSIKQGFEQYLGATGSAFVSADPFTVQETIDTIHEAGGLAVLAHPHLIKKTGLVKDVLQYDFDGIECFYARQPRDREQRWLEIALDKGWFITGGSDYHGAAKEHLKLGCSWAPETTFALLQEHYARHG